LTEVGLSDPKSRLFRVSPLYEITLRLHDMHEGRLLASTHASGKTIEELDGNAQRAAQELLGVIKRPRVWTCLNAATFCCARALDIVSSIG
jgi:hypothetical protein